MRPPRRPPKKVKASLRVSVKKTNAAKAAEANDRMRAELASLVADSKLSATEWFEDSLAVASPPWTRVAAARIFRAMRSGLAYTEESMAAEIDRAFRDEARTFTLESKFGSPLTVTVDFVDKDAGQEPSRVEPEPRGRSIRLD